MEHHCKGFCGYGLRCCSFTLVLQQPHPIHLSPPPLPCTSLPCPPAFVFSWKALFAGSKKGFQLRWRGWRRHWLSPRSLFKTRKSKPKKLDDVNYNSFSTRALERHSIRCMYLLGLCVHGLLGVFTPGTGSVTTESGTVRESPGPGPQFDQSLAAVEKHLKAQHATQRDCYGLERPRFSRQLDARRRETYLPMGALRCPQEILERHEEEMASVATRHSDAKWT